MMNRQNIEDIYELSPLQQGMLFHTLYAPKSGIYVEQVACTLKGKLHIAALQRAWLQVIERHPVLRSSFYWEEVDKPLQIVHRVVDLPWQSLDWSQMGAEEQQQLLQELLQQDQQQGFDLAEAPLLRLILIKLAEEQFQCIWSSHHILMDGWSSALLFREVFTFYEVFQHGGEVALPQPRPFRDYILWLQQQDERRAELFWREKLRGFTAPTMLGSEQRFKHATDEEQYEVRERRLSRFTTEELQLLSRQHHLTLNTLVQGAWALLLARYSGEKDVLFGATVSGRPAELEQVEAMIGLFINTLPIRIQLPDSLTLVQWLHMLQDEQVELMRYEYSSLRQVQEWSELPGGTSLFGSLLIFENYPSYAPEHQEEQSLKLEDVRVFEKTNYPLNLIVGPAEELLLRMIYNCAYFSAREIGLMLEHLEVILEALICNPEQALWQVCPLTKIELQQLLLTWNDTEASYPTLCIHQLVEAQVARSPQAPAVTFGEETLSYQELNQRANKVAQTLQKLGVGPDVLVGLCVERSLDMSIGLLGILKAGGAYVPLDPSFPPERIAFMLEDAQVPVLLTQRALADTLPAGNMHVVYLDDTEFFEQVEENSVSQVTSQHLSYVIYTSGSTGRPKGVQISHAAAVNLLISMQREPGLCAQDKLLAVTTLSFDIATLELFLPLITGAHLIIAPHDTAINASALTELLERTQSTVMQATPITWRMLLASGWQAPAHLKILCGGEAIPTDLAQTLAANAHSLYNVYGPTETTIWSTVERLEAEDSAISIGRPIANTSIYLLDSHLQPVPIGSAGELYIGGAGLSRGYLHRPDLTAEKFIPHPFSLRSGDRLYKTGDLARYLPDGRLICLGRVDFQVKLRGFRIEIGEIESVLRQHPAIQEGVVLLREDRPGDQRLVAYVVPLDLETLIEAELIHELRTKLSNHLPEYMIPADMLILRSFPRTPNNKIDRKALPPPERQGSELASEAPRSPIEQELALLWEELLGAKLVGRSDHFFALGGHSLLLTQLASRIQVAFNIEVPLRILFEAPTLAEMATSVTALLQEQYHLLPAQPIQLASRERPLPLSFAQQRLWFLQQLDLNNPSYIMPTAVRLSGNLDAAVLERVLGEIIARHESLRTLFQLTDGEPKQVILEPAPFLLSQHDLSDLSEYMREIELHSMVAQEAQRPFFLTTDPPIRACLLTLKEQEHVLLLTLHHIVSDGWSTGLLIQEIITIYTAFVQGKASPLPPLAVQYADFAIWQRERLQGNTLDTLLAYWQKELAEAPPLLNLPMKSTRPAQQTFQGAREHFHISKEMTEGLQQLARQEQVTLFMLLLATFSLLLSNYSRQNDILIGTPIANRTKRELEDVIGVFVNTLVLRTRINRRDTFEELLAQVRETTLAAYTHQDLPFESLVEVLAPERDLSHHPLFQVMFTLQNAPMPTIELADLQLQPVEINSEIAKFDLTLLMEEREGSLEATFEYNTDLFDQNRIEFLVGSFSNLLYDIVHKPEHGLWELSMLQPAEEEHILVIGNLTQREFASQRCMHEIIEEQAEWTPQALAIQQQERQISYAELNTRANQLARYLQQHGVEAEHCVGVLCERSIELVIAHLAILKAGGAYLPLDPTYPQERIAFMLRDTHAPLLLTQSYLRTRVSDLGLPVVCLDNPYEPFLALEGNNLEIKVAAEQLAYVIYTSGSTGQPKGVQISHRNLLNLVCWHHEEFKLSGEDRATLLASPAFDASTWEIWPYLSIGASLHIPNEQTRISAPLLRNWLIAQNINITFLPTPLAEVLMSESWPEEVPLRAMLTGGDRLHAIPKELPFIVFNNYGPTEHTVVTTSSPIDAYEEGLPTIGFPIGNTKIYVLDDYMQPVPRYVAGELYITGEGLSRGYLQRPDLTAEKFLPNPYAENPGERLYRTGDLVAYGESDFLYFLDRSDQQVKVRGFRIELTEIELALREQVNVTDTVVLVREDQPGDKRLVAYVVPTEEEQQAELIQALRKRLQERLPDYMVPGDVVLLKELPLTSNGKVDRRALPLPQRRLSPTTYKPPRTPVEQQLATLWEELLHVTYVGLYDEFFTLGGHSLLLTQLATRIRNTFHLDLPLRDLFEADTLEQMAVLIEESLREQHYLVSTEPIQRVSRAQPLPLSFAQQRLWFLQQLEPQNTAYTIPAAIRLKGALNTSILQQALQAIVQRHESLRTTFLVRDGEPVQFITDGSIFTLDFSDLTHLSEQQREENVRKSVLAEVRKPFNLEQELPVRAQLLKLTEQEHVLLLVMHHIASDGWSTSILIREVAELYTAFLTRENITLTELPVQYADFAAWQRAWLQGETLAALLSYWTEQLRDIPIRLDLPTDHPHPAIQTFNGSTFAFRLPSELSQELGQLARREQVTLFMLLLAAFQLLLACYSRQNDVVVGTPIANRTRHETEQLIGVFINTLVLRTQIHRKDTFQNLLTQIRETTLAAYTHQDLPFEMLVEALAPERNLGHHPLFQVMFGLQNTPASTFEQSDITLQSLEIPANQAKFELTLMMEEQAEGLHGVLEYNTDLFERETITRLVRHYQRLLEQVAADPGQPLWRLSPLSAIERYQLLTVWNTTEQEYPQTLCVQQLFEAQVERTPQAIALRFQDQEVSYNELNQRANQLAHYLQRRGVGPDILVGLHLKRGLEVVIALLAILKAGGAYLPLEISLPQERLTLLLEQSGAHYVLTHESLRELLPQQHNTILPIETLWTELEGLPQSNPVSRTLPENLAYVLFTSGSTGLPKGVMVTHQGLVNYLCWARQTYSAPKSNGSPIHSPLSFDLTVTSLFIPLLTGQPALLLPQEQEVEGLLEILRSGKQFSLVKLTPAHLTLLNQWLSPEEAIQSTQAFIIGGEELLSEQIHFWQEMAPQVRLINEYGPTETVVGCCVYEVQEQERFVKGVPIGKPIANTQLYVLDAWMQPVPVGVAGELYIGGAGVARGYLQQPALTAERFVPNPYGEGPGARLYRSGDLARYYADGTLEYLGRIDTQVKIRGFRIELGEIEAMLNQHPQVQQNIVIVHETPEEEKQLVAYYVGEAKQRPESGELYAYLKERLPHYMLPTHYIFLEQLPLTTNGKLNRKLLPMPGSAGKIQQGQFVAARDTLELQLVQIWEEILQVHPISVQSSFFELGGHSLLAMRLISEIEKHFARKLPLSLLFQQATIEQLAHILRREQVNSVWSPLVALHSGNQKPPFFCVHPAPGSVFCYLDLAQQMGEGQPFYGLQARGLDGEQTPLATVEEMAAYYIAAMREIQPTGPYFIGGHSFGGTVAFEMAQQLRRAGEEIGLLAILDNAPPLPDFEAHLEPVSDEVGMALELSATATIIGKFLGKDLAVSYDELVTLSMEEQELYFLKRLQDADFITEDTGLSPLRGLLNVQRKNGEAHMRYKPQVYSGQITLIRANTINYKEFGVLEPVLAAYLDEPELGWSRYTTQKVQVYQIPCEHIAMLTQPHVQTLALHLKTCIEEVLTALEK